MSNTRVKESLNRIQQQLKERMQKEGLSEKVKLLKMLEELLVEQVADENFSRTVSKAR